MNTTGEGLIYRSAWPRVPTRDWLAYISAPFWIWRSPQGWTYVAWDPIVEIQTKGPERFQALRTQMAHWAAHWHWAPEADPAPPATTPRWFGGFAFMPGAATPAWWRAFGDAHWMLPRYLYTERPDGQAWLTMLVPRGERPQWPAIPPPAPTPPPLAATIAQHEGMSWPQWLALMQRAFNAMQQGQLRKVVLARTRHLIWATAPTLISLWSQLEHAYPATYRFAFQPKTGHALLGATPELLVRVQGKDLETMALAGSIARGNTPQEDERLADRLRRSRKDQEEHRLVVQAIQEALAPLTETLIIEPIPRIRRLRHIQHLETPIRGRLREGNVLTVVERLHPTPALGGYPRAAALTFIAKHEPVPRGWYAAPIGWVTLQGDGAFAAVIRSAVVQGPEAWLYAGAGIMPTSDPQREWDEIDLKFQAMEEILAPRVIAD
ncbi:MAG: isochorismate synthase [Chloroflexi bacterium]|nr:isochorismate synthase [Chloroflexota bacterium]